MNPVDPLAQLPDIHLPDPIGFWPLAPVWWFAIAVLVLCLLLGLWRYLRYRARNYYRREALRMLAGLPDAADDYLQQLNRLLKRTALTAYGPQTGHLYGSDWLAFLSSTLPAAANQFTTGAGQALAAGPYQRTAEVDCAALRALASYWIKQHQPLEKIKVKTKAKVQHA